MRGCGRRVFTWSVLACSFAWIGFPGGVSCASTHGVSKNDPAVKKGIGYVAEAQSDMQTLDIYLPREARNAPVLIFVHGGGWRRGSKDQMAHAQFASLFPPQGFVTVVPNYRLSTVAGFPAQIEDLAGAFAWTYRNIHEYGGDPNKIFVSGHSAGGHLACLLALDTRYLDRLNVPAGAVKGVLALSAIYDIPEMKDRALKTLVEPAFGTDPSAWRQASPIHHVRSGLPPFLILYAQRDTNTLKAQARRFADALKQKNTPVVVAELEREGHLSVLLRTRRGTNPAAPHMLEFMHRLLASTTHEPSGAADVR